MNKAQEQKRRMVELVLIVAIALIGRYISRPHPADGPRELLHWAFALLAAYMLGAAAWTVISKPDRILVSLGYLMLGSSMTLSFIQDLAVPDRRSAPRMVFPRCVVCGTRVVLDGLPEARLRRALTRVAPRDGSLNGFGAER